MKVEQMDTTKDGVKAYLEQAAEIIKQPWYSQQAHKVAVGLFALDCLKINYEEELKGFRNGLKTLKQNRFADTSNIFIFGHALGGITAPLIASENKVRGIMVF